MRKIASYLGIHHTLHPQCMSPTSEKRKSAGSVGHNYIIAVVTCHQQCLLPFQLSATSTTVASSLYDHMYIDSSTLEFIKVNSSHGLTTNNKSIHPYVLCTVQKYVY